jgi:3-phosphoglycerate kinase
LPSVGGLLLEKEYVTLTSVVNNPKRPLMAIVGGAKITDKIDALRRFIALADFVVVGGAMANTFLLANGVETGKSLTEPGEVALAKEIMEMAYAKSQKQPFIFYLPQDGVVATEVDSQAQTRIVDWHTQVVADIENYPKQPPHEASVVRANERILDIGPFSGAFVSGAVQNMGTVIWAGTLGVTEVKSRSGLGPVGPFAHGTELVIEALLGQYGHKPFTIVGGGDTVAYVEEHKLVDAFGHVSTGGSASLELMSGKILPGIAALQQIPVTGHTDHDAKQATKVVQSKRKA